MTDDEVRIKVAADIASAVAALSDLTKNLDSIIASVNQVGASTAAADSTASQFFESLVENAQAGGVASEQLGENLNAAFTELETGVAAAQESLPEVVATLEELNALAAENGISMAGMGEALSGFQTRLAEGDASLASSLESLGLSLDGIKALSPEEQFFSIVDALQKTVPAAEQSARAVELFGESFASSADAILSGSAADLREAFGQVALGADEVAEGVRKVNDEVSDPAPVEQAKGFWADFWETWVSGADNSTTASIAWGVEIANSLGTAQEGAGNLLNFFPSLIDSATSLGDELVTMSNRIDVSVEALSELRYIASQTGAPLEGMGRIVFDLGNKISEGSKKFVEGITRLGFTLEVLRGMKTEDAFFALIQAIQETVPAAQQSQTAMELFGTRFRSVSMLLREDIDGIRTKYKELGIGISEEFALEGDRYNDAIDDIVKMQEAWKNQIAFSLLPSINSLLETLPEIGGAALVVGQAAGSFADSLLPIIGNIATIKSAGMFAWLGTLTTWMGSTTAATWLGVTALNAWSVAVAAATTPLGVGIIVMGSFIAVMGALTQAVKWYQEAQERRSAADRQAAIDASNLERINRALGASYKSLADAEKAWRTKQAQDPGGLADPYKKFNTELDDARKKVASLDAAKRAAIIAALEYKGASDVSKEFGLSELALKVLDKETKAHAESLKKGAAAAKEADAFLTKFRESVQKHKEETAKATKELDAWVKKTNEAMGGDASGMNTKFMADIKARTAEITQGIMASVAATRKLEEESFAATETGLKRRFALINKAEADETAAAKKRAAISGISAAKDIALIEAKYKEQRALSLRYTGDVLRDAEMRGVKTRDELRLEWATEKQVLADMLREREKFTRAAIQKQREIVNGAKAAADGESNAWRTGMARIAEGLDQLAGAFAKLAEITGDEKGDGAFARMGKFVGQLNVGTQAGKQMRGALDEVAAQGKLTADAVMGMAIATATAAAAFYEASDKAGTFNRQMSAMAQGAAMGAQVGGGWGALIGGFIGLLAGTFMKEPSFEKIMQQTGQQWGQQITEALARSIADTADDLFAGSRTAAQVFRLKDIIAEIGGITEENFGRVYLKLHDVFALLEQDVFSLEQASQVLNENWAEFEKAGTDATGAWSYELKEIIRLSREFGVEVEGITEAIDRQVDAVQRGANAVIAASKSQFDAWAKIKTSITDAKKEIEELNKVEERGRGVEWTRKMAEAQKALADGLAAQKTATKEASGELENLGFIAVNAYAVAIAQGKSHSEALKAAGPGLSQIQKAYEDLGLNIEDASLKGLVLQNSLLEKNPELIAGVDGLAGSFTALSNLGQLNAESFKQMQEAGQRMYGRLQAEVGKMGGTSRDALIPMASFLRAAEQAAKDLGVPLDENTQKLVDQAREQGVLGKDALTTNDILIEGIGALIEALGGTLPAAWRRAADAANQSATDMADGVTEQLPDAWQESADAADDALNHTQATIEDEFIASIGDAAETIKDMPWAEFSDRSVDATADAEDAVLELRREFARVSDQINRTDWTTWGEELAAAAIEAGDAVDGVSLGHSPGGLKEIPLKIKEAMASFRDFQRSGVSAAASVQAQIDALSGSRMGMITAGQNAAAAATGVGGGAGGESLNITFNVQAIDAASFDGITETRIIPSMVKSLRKGGRNLSDVQGVLK